MIRRPPSSTLTDTRFPYTTLFRSILGLDSLVPATGAVVQQADAVPGPPARRIESHGALQRELGRLILALQHQGDAAALLRRGRRLRPRHEAREGLLRRCEVAQGQLDPRHRQPRAGVAWPRKPRA